MEHLLHGLGGDLYIYMVRWLLDNLNDELKLNQKIKRVSHHNLIFSPDLEYNKF